MKAHQSKRKEEKPTLFDRLVTGVFSGFVAFVTFGIIWVIISGLPYVGAGVLLPFYFLWIPSLFFAFLGFIMAEDVMVGLLSRIWYFIYLAFDGDPNKRNYK